MSEIRKILELTDNLESTESERKSIPPEEKLPPNPLISPPENENIPKFVDSHFIQVKPNYPFSDYTELLQLYTPIEDPPEELKERFEEELQLLLPPVLPTVSEDRYYDYCCQSYPQPRVTYEEFVEIVDLAAECGFNFVVVSDKVSHHDIDPIEALNTFLIYCDIIQKSKSAFVVEKTAKDEFFKAMQTINYYCKMIPNYDEKCAEELDREQAVRETWACFSPLRVADKRFAVANGILMEKLESQEYYSPLQEDFSILFDKEEKKHESTYSLGEQIQEQKDDNEYNEAIVNEELMKNMITDVKIPVDETVAEDVELSQEQALEFANEQIDAEQLFTEEPNSDEINKYLKYYKSFIGQADLEIDGYLYDGTLKIGSLQRCVHGLLQIRNIQDIKKETFPGIMEFDFSNSEVENVCVSGNWRWCTEKVESDGTLDIIKVMEEEDKLEARVNEAKAKKISLLKKKLSGKEINISEFFELEENYGSGFK